MINDEDDTSAKCRERRRRRIQMRRFASVSISASSSSSSSAHNCSLIFNQKTERSESKLVPFAGETSKAISLSSGEDKMAINLGGVSSETPVFGVMSVAGRLRDMEDAFAVRTDLCRPAINLSRPVHFFGVYDGHGGPHVAALCRERMHVIMEEELMRVNITGTSESGGSSSRQAREDAWRRALTRSFMRMDEVALRTCACGGAGGACTCHPMELALAGSTAVVAIITQESIIVANCGDSRAVLCRSGRPIPLSFDQKPDRVDELARIEASGGKVIFLNGARVEGMLAMSRAIGDKLLKPIVTAEPEISFTRRDKEDECLIIASDGLWDVLSNEMACEVAHECLLESDPPVLGGSIIEMVNPEPRIEADGAAGGAVYSTRSTCAAALLTRLALGRNSSDNISVIVVDLKSELERGR